MELSETARSHAPPTSDLWLPRSVDWTFDIQKSCASQ